MREVAVVGVAMTPFGKHHTTPLATLGARAALGALRDADAHRSSIDAVYCGNVLGGMMVGQRSILPLGMGGVPVVNVENACSSSATALHEAFRAVANGVHDTILVIGSEKLTSLGGGPLPLAEEDHEVANGQLMPAVYAMRAHRYMHEFGATREDLAQVAVKARRHGARNPYAQMRKEITVEEVLSSRPVASPLTLFQSCPNGDGAAALVVTALDNACRFAAPPVTIRASVLHSGTPTAGFRDMTLPHISEHSAQEAYEQAGIGPSDIDVVELHDAFTIAELLYYEAFGFAERGGAVALLRSGATSLGGSTVVNPSGGLLSKGHPIGATGAAQAVEIVWQLRGQGGDRQVAGARWGMTHATGGGMSMVDHGACTIHILEASGRPE